MVPISNTGPVPNTVTWYWHFVCTEPNFCIWRDILQKSASTSWYLTVTSWNLVYQRIDNFFQISTHINFGSQEQLKTNWAHFFEHKERPQCANIWQSLPLERHIPVPPNMWEPPPGAEHVKLILNSEQHPKNKQTNKNKKHIQAQFPQILTKFQLPKHTKNTIGLLQCTKKLGVK